MDELRVRLDVAGHKAMLDGRPLHLARLQFGILAYLAERVGQAVPREHIMRDVWGTEWVGNTKTLDMHVSTLRQRLGDDATNPRYIATVRGIGFRLNPGTVELVGLAADPHVAQVRALCDRALSGVSDGWVSSEVGAFATSVLELLPEASDA